MSPFAWILVGLLVICPHNEASKSEPLCTCQQSGLGPFGPSSTSSHQSGHGTFEHSVSSSENSAPIRLGHYVKHAISSAAGLADSLLPPFGHDKVELGSFGHSGSSSHHHSSHHHVSITYGQSGQSKSLVPLGTRLFEPLESSSGISKISGSLGSGHYGTYATPSTVQSAEAAETRPFPNGPDEGGPGPIGLGPFGNSGSSSHQHVSITFGQSGQSKTLGQGLGQYNSLADVQTKPSKFESVGGGSVSSGSVPFGQLEPSSEHHATVSVGLSGAISNQPGYGQVGLSGSSSVQNGTRLFGPSEESSGDSTPNGSFGSGHYVTYTTSAGAHTAEAAGTRPSPNVSDAERPALLKPGPFEHLGSSSHVHVSVNFGQLGQNKSSEPGHGQYIQYNNSVEATAAEAAEKNPSTMGGEPVPSGSGPFSHSEPSSDHHVTVSVGISGTTSDQPDREPIGSPESGSIQHGTRLFEPSEASSVTSTSSDSFGSGPYSKYSTSSTAQTAEESQTRPSPDGSDGGGSGQLVSGLFENSGPSSNQQVPETFGQLGQSQSLGQGLGQYISYNKSVAEEVAEAEKTKPSQFEKDGREPLSSGSVSFGQSEPNSDNRVAVSIGQSGASSDQPGGEIVGPSGSSSDQHEAKLFEPSEDSSGTSTQNASIGSGLYVTHTTSSTAQTAEAAETRPSPDGSDGFGPAPLGSGLFGHSGSHQNVSVTFVQPGQSKSLGTGLEQYIQYNNSVAGAAAGSTKAKQSQAGLDGGGSVPSGSGLFGQSEPSPYQGITVSSGLSSSIPDQLGQGQVGQSGYSTVQNGTGLFGSSEAGSGTSTSSETVGSGHYLKFPTLSVSQTAEEPETRPSSTGPDTGGISQFASGPFGQSGSTSNEHVSINFGQGGAEVPSGSVSFEQQEHSSYKQIPTSYQQISGPVGQYATSSDQPGRGPDRLSESSSGQNGIRLSGTSEANSGTSTSSGSFGPEHYLTSSVGQTAEELGTGSSAIGPDTGGSGPFGIGPFGQSDSSSKQHTPITFGQPGQSQSSGEGPGHYNQYSNSAEEETKPAQFGPDGGLAVSSGSITFEQPGPNSYQQISGSAGQYATSSDQPGPNSYQQISGSSGQYATSSDQPGRDPVRTSGSGQNGNRLFGPSESNSGTHSSGSFGYGHNLKYATSSVGQTAEEPETGPSPNGAHTGGPGAFGNGPFGQSGSSSNQHTSIPFGASGQSKSLGEGQGQYNQYINSVAADTKPSQFGSDGGLAVSSGSEPFEQPGPNSYQQISGSSGQYATSSDQPGPNSYQQISDSAGQYATSSDQPGPNSYQQISGSSGQYATSSDQPGRDIVGTSGSGQNGNRLFGPSESNSGTHSSESFGYGHNLKYATSSVGQTAEELETGPSPNGAHTGGPGAFGNGPFGQSGSGSNQHTSITFGASGQSKSLGEGLGQYNQYINSVAPDTKPSQFGSDGGLAVSSGSEPFEQPGPNSYQQISDSAGQYATSSDQPGSSSYQQISGSGGQYATSQDQPGRGPVGTSGSSSGQNANRLFGTSEASSGSPTSSGSFGSEHYWKYPTSSVGQTPEEPETGPLSNGAHTGGPGAFGNGPFGQSGSSSNQHTSIPFGASGQSKSLGEGLGQYNQYINSVAADAKPYQFGSDGGLAVSSGSEPFEQPGPNSYQQISGSSGQYATSSDQPVPNSYQQISDSAGQYATSSDQPGSSSYQQISGSGGQYATSPDQPARGPVGTSGSSSDQNANRLFGTSEASSGSPTSSGSFGSEHYWKYPTSSVGQAAEDSEAGLSIIGPDTGGSGQFGLGPFGQSGSSPNQHTPITFGASGQSKSLGEGLGQYNQYINSVAADTKPSQFGPDGGLAVSSGSVSFEQPRPNSYQQTSGSAGQHATSSDQPGRGPVQTSRPSSGENGNRLYGPSEANPGTSTSNESFGSENYKRYPTSSVGQTAEDSEAGSSPIGPDTGGSGQFGHGPFGQTGSSPNQHSPITFGASGQSKSLGEGLGQYNQYINSAPEETKPFQFGADGGLAVSTGSASFEQPGPNSYQQIPGSAGQYATSTDQPGRDPVETSGSTSGQNGNRPFGPSESNSGTHSSVSFGYGHNLKYTTSSVGQTAEEPETRPSPNRPHTGGPGPFGNGPFGQSGSSPNQHTPITFGASGQSKSLGEGLGQYNQYINSVAADTKPSQFGSDGGLAVSSGSEPFEQPGPSSYQEISGSFGPYGTISDQPGSGAAGQSKSLGEGLGQYNHILKLSSDQPGTGLFGPSGASSGTSTQSGSLGYGNFLKHTTPSIAQTADAAEARPFPSGLDGQGQGLLGPGLSGHSGYSANKQVSATAGNSGPSKSSGQGLGQYIPYSNSVAAAAGEAAETKPAEFGPDGGGSVPSGSVPFGQPGPNSYQRLPGSFGPSDDSSYQRIPGSFGPSDDSSYQRIPGSFRPSDDSSYQQIPGSFRPADDSSNQQGNRPDGQSGPSSDEYESEVFGTSVGSSDQPERNPVGPSGLNSVQLGAGLFRPSDSSSGTSIPSGSFGSGHNVAHTTSPAAYTSEAPETGPPSIGPDGGRPFEHSGYSSQQHAFVPFGQSGHTKSPEQGLGQYIPYSNSVAGATTVAADIKPSLYGPYRGALAPSEHGSSRPSENSSDQPVYGQFETTGISSDHQGSGLNRPLGPNTGYFEPSEIVGPGPYMQYTTTSPGQVPYMQYTTTSPALTAEEAETEPPTFVKNGEEPRPTGFTPFRPSGHSSYKPVSVTFNSYGTSADYPEAGTFGLSSTISDQPAPRPYETWEQSTRPLGTGGPLEQGYYVPYTISPEGEMGTVGRPSPGLLGSSVISLPSGMYGQGPGIYIPYRNGGGAVTATAQKEPSPYEPYSGEEGPSAPSSEQPALGYIGPSTPSSYEPSTGQSTVASEASGQLGSGLYNSNTPLETTTVVAVSPVDKKAIMKSASRLSSLLTTARVSIAISYLLSSGGFNPSSLSKVISYLIKSIPEAQPGISGNEMLIQALLEVIASLVHILSSATVGEVGNCPSSSSSLVGQSITHALGG